MTIDPSPRLRPQLVFFGHDRTQFDWGTLTVPQPSQTSVLMNRACRDRGTSPAWRRRTFFSAATGLDMTIALTALKALRRFSCTVFVDSAYARLQMGTSPNGLFVPPSPLFRHRRTAIFLTPMALISATIRGRVPDRASSYGWGHLSSQQQSCTGSCKGNVRLGGRWPQIGRICPSGL